jgi:hypothetical protein
MAGNCYCRAACDAGNSICRVRLHCCREAYCIPCFSNILASNHFKPCISCRCCRAQVKSWDVVHVNGRVCEQGRSTRSKTNRSAIVVQEEEVVSTHSLPEPRLESEPQQYHKNLIKEIREKTDVLSMTIPIIKKEDEDASSEGLLRTFSLEMVGDEFDLNDHGSERQKSQIERIFLMLHPSLLGSFRTESLKSLDEIVLDDYSILHRCIHALATGHTLQSSRVMNGARWANQRASTFAASDIIRNAAAHTTGVLKKLIGNQLAANPISQSLNKILNKIGIATSKRHIINTRTPRTENKR